MVHRLKSYLLGYTDPTTFPSVRFRQLVEIKLYPPDQLQIDKLDTLLPVLISKRKINEIGQIREHINAMVKGEVFSLDEMKTLIFLRGIEVLAEECEASMKVQSDEHQKFLGKLPRL